MKGQAAIEQPIAGPEHSESATDLRERHWTTARVGDLCALVNGDAFKASDWATSGTPIIRIQNLNNPAKPFNYWSGSVDRLVQVRDGDVLLAWSGTPGTSFGAHLWRRGIGVLNQHIFRVDLTTDRVTSEWFVRAVNYSLHTLIRKAHGAVGLAHVTKGEVEALEILLPPVPEQQRIAGWLTRGMNAVDVMRRAASDRLAAAEAFPSALLRKVFEGPDASRWEKRRIEDLCDLLPSKSIASDGDVEVRAITTACLTERGFRAAGIKSARMHAGDVPMCTVRPGEILVARSNTPDLVGRASMYDGEPKGIVASDLTIRLWARGGEDRVLPEYLAAYMSFLFQTGYWRRRAGGASGSMKKITREQLSAEVIPVPTTAEQRRIGADLSARLAAAEVVVTHCREDLAAIKAMPASLLREAFGESTHKGT